MRRLAPALLACLPLLAAADGTASFSVGHARVDAPVQSARALRDAGVVRQRFDYSCGPAALATLLTYGLDDPVDEATILAAVVESQSEGSLARLKERGVSLLDLARYAQARGYHAQGFLVAADQVARIRRPVLVFVKPHGYEHFAVLKGIDRGRAYLADPARGNVRMPLYQFLEMWADGSGRGIVLAVEPADRPWPQHSALAIP